MPRPYAVASLVAVVLAGTLGMAGCTRSNKAQPLDQESVAKVNQALKQQEAKLQSQAENRTR